MSEDAHRLSRKIQLLLSRHPGHDLLPLLYRLTNIKDSFLAIHKFSNTDLERYVDIALER